MEEQIKELLRHLRFVHFTLVILCFTIIYFVEANDDPEHLAAMEDFEEAFTLANELHTHSIRSLLPIEHRGKDVGISWPQLADRSSWSGGSADNIPSLIAINWSHITDSQLPVYATRKETFESARLNSQESSEWLAEELAKNAPTQDLVTSPMNVTNLEELSRAYNQIASLRIIRPIPAGIRNPVLHLPRSSSPFEVLHLRRLEQGQKPEDVHYTFEALIASAGENEAIFPGEWRTFPFDEQFFLTGTQIIDEKSSAWVHVGVTAWDLELFYGDEVLHSAMGRSSSEQSVFPDFHTEFPALAKLAKDHWLAPIGELPKLLERDQKKHQSSASVLGVEVGRSSITFYGGLGIVLVQLYFSLHFSALLRNQSKLITDSYPWICLYDDLPAKVISFSSVSLLPVLAAWRLLDNTPNEAYDLQSSWFFVTLLLSALVTIDYARLFVVARKVSEA